jgi:hypothetical protein
MVCYISGNAVFGSKLRSMPSYACLHLLHFPCRIETYMHVMGFMALRIPTTLYFFRT